MSLEKKINIIEKRLETLKYNKEEESLTSKTTPSDPNEDRANQIEDINKTLKTMRNQKDETIEEPYNFEVRV